MLKRLALLLVACVAFAAPAAAQPPTYLYTIPSAGRFYEMRAAVHDRAGDFACRTRQNNWHDALRDLARTLTVRLHEQRLRFPLAAA